MLEKFLPSGVWFWPDRSVKPQQGAAGTPIAGVPLVLGPMGLLGVAAPIDTLGPPCGLPPKHFKVMNLGFGKFIAMDVLICLTDAGFLQIQGEQGLVA